MLHAASLCQKETFWFSCLILSPLSPRHFAARSFYLIKDKHKWPDIKSALNFIGTRRATSRPPIPTPSPRRRLIARPLHTFLNLVVLLKQFNAASASAASKDKLMTLGPWRDAIVRSVNAYPVGLLVCLSACLPASLSDCLRSWRHDLWAKGLASAEIAWNLPLRIAKSCHSVASHNYTKCCCCCNVFFTISAFILSRSYRILIFN